MLKQLYTFLSVIAITSICHSAPFDSADLSLHSCMIVSQTPIMDGGVQVGVDYEYECLDDPHANCNPDPAACTEESFTCNLHSGTTGRCLQKISNYDCVKREVVCTDQVVKNSCFPFTINNNQPEDDTLADVAAAMKTAETISENMDMVGGEVRIFNGQSETCHEITSNGESFLTGLTLNPTAYLTFFPLVTDQIGSEFNSTITYATLVNMMTDHDLDCCKTDPSQVDTGFMFCNQDDIKIATSIKNLTSHFVGLTYREFCPAPVAGSCPTGEFRFVRYQHYCTYADVLSRIVQEQGREQLNEIITSGYTNAIEMDLNYDYYGPTSQWLTPQDVNGTTVSIFQRGNACKLSAMTSGTQSADYFANKCDRLVSKVTYIALCDEGTCDPSELTVPPYGGSLSGWSVIPINPEDDVVSAWSNWIVAGGSCSKDGDEDWDLCSYKLSAMNPDSPANTRQTTRVGWLMWGETAGWSESQWIGNIEMQYEQEIFGSLNTRSEIEVRWRIGETPVWEYLFIPARIEGTPLKILDDPHTEVIGSCNWQTGFCSYDFMLQIEVEAKPWSPTGNAAEPDCSGFTIDQIMMLNFDEMDLGDFVDEIGETMAPQRADMIASALATGQGPLDATIADDNKALEREATVLLVTPQSGLAPITVRAAVPAKLVEYEYVGGEMVANEIEVISAMADWGDGQTSPLNYAEITYNGETGPVFFNDHDYTFDDTFEIKVTLVTSDGEKEYTSTIFLGDFGVNVPVFEDGIENQSTQISVPGNPTGSGTFNYSEYEHGGVRESEIELESIPIE